MLPELQSQIDRYEARCNVFLEDLRGWDAAARFLVRHFLHHMRQARRIAGAPGFADAKR